MPYLTVAIHVADKPAEQAKVLLDTIVSCAKRSPGALFNLGFSSVVSESGEFMLMMVDSRDRELLLGRSVETFTLIEEMRYKNGDGDVVPGLAHFERAFALPLAGLLAMPEAVETSAADESESRSLLK